MVTHLSTKIMGVGDTVSGSVGGNRGSVVNLYFPGFPVTYDTTTTIRGCPPGVSGGGPTGSGTTEGRHGDDRRETRGEERKRQKESGMLKESDFRPFPTGHNLVRHHSTCV